MKPPLTYFGGKTRLAARLVDLMAGVPHGHYVEPYAGSLAVLLAKPPAAHETVNDLDERLVTFWRVLREQPDEFVRVCSLTPHARAELSHAQHLDRIADDLDDLEIARLVWVALTQGRVRARTSTGWRHYQNPSGSSGSMPDYLDGYVSRMHPAVDRLHRVSLECRPALDVIGDYGRHDGVLLYVDPPYPASVRQGGPEARDRNRRHASSRAYAVEMLDDDAHRDLAEALRGCRASVVLSGYPSALYDDELYPDWCRVEIPTATGQGGVWSERTEVVWSNRDLTPSASTLFDGMAG